MAQIIRITGAPSKNRPSILAGLFNSGYSKIGVVEPTSKSFKEIFEILTKRLPEEMLRLDKIAGTMHGWQTLINIYKKQFGEYQHGSSVVYEIARVNILRDLRGEEKLI